jgi:SAM-dependent methyltransferase
MKPREQVNSTFSPLFGIVWNNCVHKELKRITTENSSRSLEILDVGGRESPYTVGIDADVTISELPRETTIQEQLNLGINDEIINRIIQQRSNIKQVIFDDMTSSKIPRHSYDVALAVEVLEHVEEDELFIKNIHNILKPNGYFIMTTPNGGIVPNRNPDHKRHYTKTQLSTLLSQHFSEVVVHFAARRGSILYISLRSPSRWWFAAPLIYACKILANIQSRQKILRLDECKAEKLIAIACKR